MRRVRGACEGLKEEGAGGGEEEQMRKMWCKSFSLRLRVSRPTALPRPCRDQLVENKFMHPETFPPVNQAERPAVAQQPRCFSSVSVRVLVPTMLTTSLCLHEGNSDGSVRHDLCRTQQVSQSASILHQTSI